VAGTGFKALFSDPKAEKDVTHQALAGTSASADPHAYYFALASRPDCFAAYSLRNRAQVDALWQGTTQQGGYLYPTDPDPRRQDAMKIALGPDISGLLGAIDLPLGAHHPQNLFVVIDRWWGAEFAYSHMKVSGHKGDPYIQSGRSGEWIGLRTLFVHATQRPQTLPAGGPYVAMVMPQSMNNSNIRQPFFRAGQGTNPNWYMPQGVPTSQARRYTEAVAPMENEGGIVAERWTRFFYYFERAADLDWTSDVAPAGPRRAYRWSLWLADTERDPIRILHEAVVAIDPAASGFTLMRIKMGVGNADQDIPAGRGPLTAYARNAVVLHGTSKSDVLALLQKPIDD
jgi:hypothetical protein